MVEAKRIMAGTFGELWLDNDYIAEATKSQAKVEFNKEEIKLCGTWFIDTKVTGCTGKGSMTLKKVNSRMGIKLKDYIKNKKDLRFTLISKLDDPDAWGAERCQLTGVNVDDLTLFDWEAGTPGEVEVPFTFTGYEYLDVVEPQE